MAICAAPTNKPQPLGIAYSKAITLLKRHAIKSGGGLISFAECRRVMSWLYHLDREEVFIFLAELEAQDLIKVIPFRGVKISSDRQKSQQRK